MTRNCTPSPPAGIERSRCPQTGVYSLSSLETLGVWASRPHRGPLRGLKARAGGLSRRLWTPSRASSSLRPSLPPSVSLPLPLPTSSRSTTPKPCVWLKLWWTRTPEAGCRPHTGNLAPATSPPTKYFQAHLIQVVVLEKTLESPLDCKEIQPVHPKGNQS